MTPTRMSKKTRQLLESVTNRRARVVIQHILKHGFITTEELEKQYGYNHPPRAARDVREAGIPLETTRVRSSDGRSIAAYKFGDLGRLRIGRIQGRQAFPKKLKSELHDLAGGKCAICAGEFEGRYLQIDHRVPYEVAGDSQRAEWNAQDYMLLCSSCNRAKSWSCEHCPNWLNDRLAPVCLTCYWANPQEYLHLALREVRRLDVVWSEDEVQAYERLKQAALADATPLPEYVKTIVARYLDTVNE